MGIACCRPTSTSRTTPSPWSATNIRFGLGAVKGVGESAIESILEARPAAGEIHLAARVLRRGRPARLQQESDRGADQVGIVRLPRSSRRKALFEKLEIDRRFGATRREEEGARTEFTLRHARRSHVRRRQPRSTGESPRSRRMARRREAPLREGDARLLHHRPSAQQVLSEELKTFANATTDSLHQTRRRDREHRRHRLADEEVEDQEGAERREADGEVHPRRSVRLRRGRGLLRSLRQVREVARQRRGGAADRRGEGHRRGRRAAAPRWRQSNMPGRSTTNTAGIPRTPWCRP